MKKLALIGFLASILCMGLVINANAQKRTITDATIDERGYISVQFKEGSKEWGFDYLTKEEFNDYFQDKFNGEVYTDRYGNKLPVFVSVNNKKFVIKTSGTGKKYRYYITVKL